MDTKKDQKSGKYSIYRIKNKQNDLCYIGQTIHPVEKRWERHLWLAKSGRSDFLIHSALRNLGPEAFEIEVLVSTDNLAELDQLEIKAIEEYKSLHPGGYNMTPGANGGRASAEISRQKRDSLQLAADFSEKNFKAIADLCRKNGIVHLKLSKDFEITLDPRAIFPTSSYKKKKASEVSDASISVENQYTDEEILMWSSAGIQEGAH